MNNNKVMILNNSFYKYFTLNNILTIFCNLTGYICGLFIAKTVIVYLPTENFNVLEHAVNLIVSFGCFFCYLSLDSKYRNYKKTKIIHFINYGFFGFTVFLMILNGFSSFLWILKYILT